MAVQVKGKFEVSTVNVVLMYRLVQNVSRHNS